MFWYVLKTIIHLIYNIFSNHCCDCWHLFTAKTIDSHRFLMSLILSMYQLNKTWYQSIQTCARSGMCLTVHNNISRQCGFYQCILLTFRHDSWYLILNDNSSWPINELSQIIWLCTRYLKSFTHSRASNSSRYIFCFITRHYNRYGEVQAVTNYPCFFWYDVYFCAPIPVSMQSS